MGWGGGVMLERGMMREGVGWECVCVCVCGGGGIEWETLQFVCAQVH
jgi:hypothetical protein